MSVRRATAPTAVPAPTATTAVTTVGDPMFNFPKDRLHAVLHAAHTAAPVELTDDAFEATVHHEVEAVGARMRLSREVRKRMKEAALRNAREGGKYAGKQIQRGSRYAAERSKQSAKDLVDLVQRSWAGARKPAHWLLLSSYDLSKRLVEDYKRAIEKRGMNSCHRTQHF